MSFFDCQDSQNLLRGMRNARQAIARGELIIIPTDTVYGIAADAFSATAVQSLLSAKGRTRQSPPPVLVPDVSTMKALVADLPEPVNELISHAWPGGLTIILPANPLLSWDLGDTKNTVAVRMPDNNIALELLAETGPLAVSSANLSGMPPAITAKDAEVMLGSRVSVYLEAGPCKNGIASTIIDATSLSYGSGKIKILRKGAVSVEFMREHVDDVLEKETSADNSNIDVSLLDGGDI